MGSFEIKGLTFSYPESERPALDHIDMTVRDGEFVLICGCSGCGKSTLLRHLKTVLTPHGKRKEKSCLTESRWKKLIYIRNRLKSVMCCKTRKIKL